jgi:hypothetical protein
MQHDTSIALRVPANRARALLGHIHPQVNHGVFWGATGGSFLDWPSSDGERALQLGLLPFASLPHSCSSFTVLA